MLYKCLCLDEVLAQLSKSNSVGWHGHMFKMEGGDVLIMALNFEVESQKEFSPVTT